mgnify:CR=1 FL=1
MAERSARARNLAHELRTREAARLVGMDDFVCVQAPFRGVSGGFLMSRWMPRPLSMPWSRCT